MRWFIVFLILANVILFFWVKQQSRPLPGASVLPPPDIGRLRLQTELEEEGELAVAESPEPPPDEIPGAVSVNLPSAEVTETGALAEVSPERSAAPRVGPTSPVVPKGDTESEAEMRPVQTEADLPESATVVTDAEQQMNGFIVAAEQSVAQAQQAAGQLAGTTPGEQPSPVEVMPEEPPADAEPVVADKTKAVCARVGPFDPEDADRVISGLPANLQLLSDTTEEYARVDRYYVLIPPLPSRAVGRQKLKELEDAGFTDTWLFPSGEYRNAISMGYFSREGGAKRHAANIAEKGFETEVREKSSIRQRRWLLLKKPDGGDLDTSLPLTADVRIESQACP